MAPPSLGGTLIAPQPQPVNQPQQIYNQEESSQVACLLPSLLMNYSFHQGRMFTADESGTVTLPLTMPPAASSLTLISNNGSHGPGITAPVSAGLHQSTPLATGPSLGSLPGGGAAVPQQQAPSLLQAPFLLPAALPLQPVHQVDPFLQGSDVKLVFQVITNVSTDPGMLALNSQDFNLALSNLQLPVSAPSLCQLGHFLMSTWLLLDVNLVLF